MPRWEADAAQRLVAASLDLFAERGYEQTTVVDIAERAGLTKSTFFRHFRDKREVLFGRTEVGALLADAIAAAPASATPTEAVEAALEAVGAQVYTSDRRTTVARRRSVIATSPELQERDALKAVALTAVMAQALRERGTPDLDARVSAQCASLASQIAVERWLDGPDPAPFGALAREVLAEVRAAAGDQPRALADERAAPTSASDGGRPRA